MIDSAEIPSVGLSDPYVPDTSMRMTGRLTKAWQRLNSRTIGTEAYWWIALQHAAVYQDMKPLVEKYARGRALDVGAGRLAWRSLLCRYVEAYTSGDVTAQHPDLDVILDISGRLPFADGSFDTVFCCSVLEHAPEPWNAFSEMWRVLKPGGTAIVSLPFMFQMHDEPHDYYRFSRYGIEHMAEKAGFRWEESMVNGGLFHLILNLPSVAMSMAWESVGAGFLIRPTTRFWLALARSLENVVGLKERFASNHIVVLRK